MPEVSALSRGTQLRVEATAGTDPGTGPSPGTKRLRSLGFQLQPQSDVEQFRPEGNKYRTLTAQGREWAQFPVTGRPTYNELTYPLASLVGNIATSQPGGLAGTGTYQHDFIPLTASEDAVKTFTMEMGSTTRAQKVSYMVFSDLSLTLNRQNTEMGGQAFGQRITDGVTWTTANVSTIPLVPILGKQIGVFADDSFATAGTTRLLRVLEVSLNITGRQGMIWPLDETQNSYAAIVETEPTVELRVRLAADAVGWGYLDLLRLGTIKYFKVVATGPVSEAALNYKYELWFCGEVTAAPDTGSDQGLYTLDWTFTAIDDGTNPPYKMRLTNMLAAL